MRCIQYWANKTDGGHTFNYQTQPFTAKAIWQNFEYTKKEVTSTCRNITNTVKGERVKVVCEWKGLTLTNHFNPLHTQ